MSQCLRINCCAGLSLVSINKLSDDCSFSDCHIFAHPTACDDRRSQGFGFLHAFATPAAEAEDFIFENFVPCSSLVVQQNREFAGRVEGLTQVGLFSLVIILLLLLLTIEQLLNAIWQVEKL